jgi:hypothetical protein
VIRGCSYPPLADRGLLTLLCSDLMPRCALSTPQVRGIAVGFGFGIALMADGSVSSWVRGGHGLDACLSVCLSTSARVRLLRARHRSASGTDQPSWWCNALTSRARFLSCLPTWRCEWVWLRHAMCASWRVVRKGRQSWHVRVGGGPMPVRALQPLPLGGNRHTMSACSQAALLLRMPS